MKRTLFLSLLLIQSLPAHGFWGGGPKVEIKPGATPMEYPQSRMTKETCGHVDLSKQMKEIRHQVGQSCYAFGAMELLNFGMPETYSALHLAQTYEGLAGAPNKNDPVTSMRGFANGLLDEAVKQGIKTGLCPESVIPSIDPLGMNSKNYEKIMLHYRKLDDQVEEVKRACFQNMGVIDLITEPAVVTALRVRARLTAKKQVGDFTPIKKEVLASFPGFNLEKLKKIYQETDDPSEFIREVAIEACRNKLVDVKNAQGKKPKGVKTTMVLYGDDEALEDERTKMLNQINETLTQGNPVGISYFTNGLIQEAGAGGPHGKHVSAVAGRTWMPDQKDEKGNVVPGGCYYLVKNSWGKDWGPTGSSKAFSLDSHPGYFMVSEEALMEHTFSATSVEYE